MVRKLKPKTVPCKVRARVAKPIMNCVVVSDLHIGCQVGLMHPDGARLDSDNPVGQNKLQRVIWSWWEEFWGEWVPEVTHGEPYCVVVNGDACDGQHHNSTTQWSHNLTDQKKHAVKILKPIVEACEGRYYHVRGTEAHVGQSGCDEEELAVQLGAVKDGEGNSARWELWLRIGKGLAHITHHIGTAGSMHYESTALMRELTEAYVESGRWLQEAPDWVCRSHRHRNAEVRVQTHKGFATVFTTPAWQLRTPFAFKLAGARQASPQIGGSLMRCGDSDLFTRHRVWSMERAKEEHPVFEGVSS